MSEPASLSLSLVGFLFSVVAVRYNATSHHDANDTESTSTPLIDNEASSAADQLAAKQ